MTTLWSWSDEEIREACDRFAATLAEFLAGLPGRSVYPAIDREALEELAGEPLPDSGASFDAVMDRFRDLIVPNSVAIPSPRFLAYINCTPTLPAILAESLAAMLNQNCTLWKLSPATTGASASIGAAWETPSTISVGTGRGPDAFENRPDPAKM